MTILAVGRVVNNPRDGRRVDVAWETPVSSPREWYFYTCLRRLWRVVSGDWAEDALLAFTFEHKPQDLELFRNHPFWRERFGDDTDEQRFAWTRFYERLGEKLLAYKDNRRPLVERLHEIADRVKAVGNFQDRYADGTRGPLKDICPFTLVGIFNRGQKDSTRRAIAAELAAFLGVDEPVPISFAGIPVLSNMNSWWFAFENKRGADDIDILWEVFAAANALVESDEEDERAAFSVAYNRALEIKHVSWNLSMGLYWVHPWHFPTLDVKSRVYLSTVLGIDVPGAGAGGALPAAEYLALRDDLSTRFQEDQYSLHSFPELSRAAWFYRDTRVVPVTLDEEQVPQTTAEETEAASEPPSLEAVVDPYSVDDIMAEGCFLERREVEDCLQRLGDKKNLILQGPPGTGKTWLAKRLAMAWVGQRNDGRKVRTVQFHPNLSYEDFVRGWRPQGDGHLGLVDGVLMETVEWATKEASARFAIVIEEINRGNPAQIFGEMLTLLEADKRTPRDALELCHRRCVGEFVHVPGNLYVIGTMNIADRSLALVDLALRRRFAFFDLEPKLGDRWRTWIVQHRSVDAHFADVIQDRMESLNRDIAGDPRLGPQFRVGHSYVTPARRLEDGGSRRWFIQVVKTEIRPLLEEYWFDAPERARTATESLLASI